MKLLRTYFGKQESCLNFLLYYARTDLVKNKAKSDDFNKAIYVFPKVRPLSFAGATLIELLLVMGLLSIMVVVLATIFTSSVDQQELSRNYSSVTSNGRFIMARLNYDINRASAVTTPVSLGSSTSTLVMTVNSNTYTYSLSGNNLQLNDSTSTDNLNDNTVKISGLNFQEFGNAGGKPTITYSFVVTGLSFTHGVNSAQTFTSTVELK